MSGWWQQTGHAAAFAVPTGARSGVMAACITPQSALSELAGALAALCRTALWLHSHPLLATHACASALPPASSLRIRSAARVQRMAVRPAVAAAETEAAPEPASEAAIEAAAATPATVEAAAPAVEQKQQRRQFTRRPRQGAF